MKRTVLVLPFALALAACVDVPDLGRDEGAVKDGDGEACPKLGCSSNSAYLGAIEFHELEESGLIPNREGLYLKALKKNGVNYRPNVTGTVLTGWRFAFVGGQLVYQTISGANLVNAELIVRNADGTTEYHIRITNASTNQHFWQAPTSATVNTYELDWQRVLPTTSDFTPVCTNPPNPEVEDGDIANRYEAILFAGDRYDTSTLTITASTATEAGNWFNIACAGNVMSKLALNRHTDATKSPQVTTTRAQRQAMLKMYTSDVCNTGDALTVNGTPLYWTSATHLTNKWIPNTTREALWTSDGALCLDTHRLDGTPDDMTEQIKAACDRAHRPVPPPCTGDWSTWDFASESQAH